ncbi:MULTISPECIES: response regulator [unclassified Halobacteriovorax]|uniref:response regulator n=1 Tax=unclassified Halobacteriovorax TaxID=2639665 RepID=UPI002FF0B688
MERIMNSKRILLVDDQVEILELLQDALISEGYEVDACAGAKEALNALGSNHYSHIISDYQMPEVNGMELASQARGFLKEDMPSFILATGDCTINDDSIKGMGVSGILPKPFTLKQVISVIQE